MGLLDLFCGKKKVAGGYGDHKDSRGLYRKARFIIKQNTVWNVYRQSCTIGSLTLTLTHPSRYHPASNITIELDEIKVFDGNMTTMGDYICCTYRPGSWENDLSGAYVEAKRQHELDKLRDREENFAPID